ncbi:MAG: aspartyl protease family protein [Capsulimonas sp.]|uniref:aspartyl protease family protein n=2 Tax=Capsulimonas sp. TaxID=2494211 RepID=UPI0032674FE5
MTTAILLCGFMSGDGRVLGEPPSEPDVSASIEGGSVTFPMKISSGLISISAQVNSIPMTFILDSGAELDMLDDGIAKFYGVTAQPSDDTMIISGTGGQIEAPGRWARIDSLKIGGAELHQSAAVLINFPPQFPAQGILGYNFLHHFVTTIDYQAMTVTFRGKAFRVDDATTIPFKLIGNIPSVEIDVDGKRGRFKVDTGNNAAIDINRPFSERNHLFEKYTRHFDTVTGLGLGGEVRSRVVRIQTLTLGTQKIKNLIGHISLQTKGALTDSKFDGLLGFEVLSRFRVTLDYPSNKIVLEKANAEEPAFEYNRSGIGFSVVGGAAVVSDLVPAGPGEEAGVKVGDEMLEINGVSIDTNSIDFAAALFAKPGAAVKIKLCSADKSIREVTVTLHELL